jgi:hypothetical protein
MQCVRGTPTRPPTTTTETPYVMKHIALQCVGADRRVCPRCVHNVIIVAIVPYVGDRRFGAHEHTAHNASSSHDPAMPANLFAILALVVYPAAEMASL